MIRAFTLLLAILLAGWFVADSMKHLGPGYVLIYFNHYSLETSVWVGSLLLFVAVLLLYFIIQLTVKLLQLARFTWRFRRSKKRQYLEQSVNALLQDNYADAERYALRNGQFSDYILAAKAAVLAENSEQARAMLKQAALADGVDLLSLRLIHFDIAELDGKTQECQNLLEQLLAQQPQHIAVLKRAVSHYIKQQELAALAALLPALLKKQKVQHQYLQKTLLAKTGQALFAHAVQQNNEQQLQQIWHKISKTAARNEVLADYCSALITLGNEKDAEKLLFKRLRSTFDESCLVAYAQLSFNSKEQLDYLHTMDQQHPYNAELQLALATVQMKEQLWDEAKHSLDKSLQIKPSKQAYQQLAYYYQQQQQLGLAQQSLHKALAMC